MDAKAIADLIDRLESLRSLALTEQYSDGVLELLRSLTIGFGTTTVSVEYREAFRARKLERLSEVSTIRDLWHPPANKILRFGRANLPHVPMLYCASNELTALKEVNAQVGDLIAIMRLEPRIGALMPHCFSIGALLKNYRIGGLRNKVIATIASIKGHTLRRSLIVDRFHVKVFKERSSRLYPLTAAIAQDFLLPERIDGLMYPSAVEPSGTNMALKPDSALQLLAVCSVKIIRILRPVGSKFMARYEAISLKIDPDGTIHWKS